MDATDMVSEKPVLSRPVGKYVCTEPIKTGFFSETQTDYPAELLIEPGDTMTVTEVTGQDNFWREHKGQQWVVVILQHQGTGNEFVCNLRLDVVNEGAFELAGEKEETGGAVGEDVEGARGAMRAMFM